MSAPDVPAPAGTSPVPVPTLPAPARSRPRWVPFVLLVVGIGCLVAVVPLFRHGVVSHAFPSYVRDDPVYEVTRWSAPWIASSLALGGVGVLSLLVAAGRLLRRQDHAPAPVRVSEPSALDPRPTEAAREY